MPVKTNKTIARQWELLKLLPSRSKPMSAKKLAEALRERGFEVTKRTVERDLNELMLLFPIDCNNQKIRYGWRWMEEAHFDLPGLTLAEALSTRLLADFLKPLLPPSIQRSLKPRFDHAEAKLKSLESNRLTGWAEKVRVVQPGINLLPPSVDQEVLETVQEALLADEQVEIVYHAAFKDEASTQTIHPLGLVQRGPITYLVATAFEYEDARLYAMHRIAAATRKSAKCRRPEGFSLDDYIATGALQYGGGASIELKLSISDYLARILSETPLSEDMKIVQENGEFVVTCTTADSWQLHWWILSWGEEIEVLAPKSLRRAIIDRISRAAAVYNLL